MSQALEAFETYLKSEALLLPQPQNSVWSRLWEAEFYALNTGGKRFRPLLSLHAAEALGVAVENILPWAAAVEMIHTYSLVHDDLPCLDNDDFRRGRPTTHKQYGEPLALLAGDGLLTEAFTLLGRAYRKNPELGLSLVTLLGEAAGPRGMIGGQVMDISEDSNFKTEHIELIHQLKTGALIRASVEGAAVVAGLDSEKRLLMRTYGELLGLAFQLADDLLDHVPENPESTSYIAAYGLEKTSSLLRETSAQALATLDKLSLSEGSLADMIKFNLKREK